MRPLWGFTPALFGSRVFARGLLFKGSACAPRPAPGARVLSLTCEAVTMGSGLGWVGLVIWVNFVNLISSGKLSGILLNYPASLAGNLAWGVGGIHGSFPSFYPGL